jgi:hypothetical protein
MEANYLCFMCATVKGARTGVCTLANIVLQFLPSALMFGIERSGCGVSVLNVFKSMA